VSVTFIIKLFNHFCNHSTRYLFILLIAYLIFGLWPFNFTARNEARISPEGGLNIARPGSVYTAAPSEKLHNLNQFTIYIDVVTSSDGLNSFAKILSYAFNQQNANFIVGQWKDGLGLHLRSDGRAQEIHFGEFGVLKINERVRSAISFNGQVLQLFVNGENRVEENRGPLAFKRWIDTYPLVIGTDAVGASQWKGCIYEASIYDRSLSPAAVARLSDPNGRNGTRENPPVSPFAKGGKEKGERADGILRQAQDDRPLVHYVFKTENTYETVFRGKRALGVRDLGKGEPADLVIPEYFEPYERVFLGWEDNWMQYKSNWLDLAVNILGFVPFGVLLVFASRAKKCLSVLVPECLSEEKEGTRDEGVGTSAAQRLERNSQQPPFDKLRVAQPQAALRQAQGGTGTRQENPPVSPFMRVGGWPPCERGRVSCGGGVGCGGGACG
jgi:hypothetical protein